MSRRRCYAFEVDVSLIQVPYHAGDESSPSASGARCLVDAGAADTFASLGLDAAVEEVARGGPFRDTAAAAAAVNGALAEAVGRAVASERLPVVLAGSCNAALGAVAGFEHARCGIVWIDAHPDFNTPESTASGFFPGMTMAILVGHCYAAYWSRIGDATPIAEGSVVMLGIRDVSPDAERERLERSAVRVVRWAEGQPQGDVERALEELASRVDDVYLHVDLDGLSPEAAPGVVDEPVPGGLSLEQAEHALRRTGDRFRIRAATLATFAPARDVEDRTLHAGLRLLGVLAEHASVS